VNKAYGVKVMYSTQNLKQVAKLRFQGAKIQS